MENETFELLTKMYSDFSKRFDNMDNRLDNMDNRLDNMDNRLKTVENGQRKVESLIENDVKNDIKALYDGYNQSYEKLIVIEKKVDDLSSKIDKQEVEIKVIKGGKA